MVKFKKIKLFTKANICYCDVIIDNKQIEIILHFDIILKYQLKDKIEVTIDTYNNILYDNNLLKAKNLSYTLLTDFSSTKSLVYFSSLIKLNSYKNLIAKSIISLR